MLDKLFGKKEKGIQIFNIPEKKYCHEKKKLQKMDKKDLADVINDMDKYITNLIEKLELGKKQYERSQQRCQETAQKSKVINQQMARITNQHQQLQVKFTNLQSSLEMMIMEKEGFIKSQAKYIEQHGLSREKVKDMNKIIEIYQSQVAIAQKMTQQNKQLKDKCTNLEGDYHVLSQKYNEVKLKSTITAEKTQADSKQTHEDESQQKQSDESNSTTCVQCKKFQTILEGKEQIVTSLNKQIFVLKEKVKENEDKIEQLNEELSKVHKKIQAKDEEINQFKKQVGHFKNNENMIKKTEKKLKQECQGYKQNTVELENELRSLKEKFNKVQQEKNKLQQFKTNNDEQTKKLVSECEKLKIQVEKKQIQVENINQKLKTYEKEIVELSKLSSEIKSKENEIVNFKNQTQQQKNKNQDLKRSLQSLEEDYQIKLRKLEFATNQERIKAEGLKRSLSNLEAQEEQNKKNLDSMYETKMIQQGKIAQMEKKLKEYKHLIQYLKKQKVELQKTFEKKIKNMQEMVIHEAEQEEVNHSKPSVSTPLGMSPSPRILSDDDYEKETVMYQNKIACLEEQVDRLNEENMNLRLEKDQLHMANQQLRKNVKNLAEKRQEVIREIKKLTSVKGIEPPSQKQLKQSQQNRANNKKAAEKAYKGFDILAKQLSALYKDFIKVHLPDIQKKEIKQLQNTINSIVRKSLDMKDIFQDYL